MPHNALKCGIKDAPQGFLVDGLVNELRRPRVKESERR